MISKKQLFDENFQKNIFFLNRGRDALAIILKILHLNQKQGILLPSYIGWSPKEGSGVFDPIEADKVYYSFYKLNMDLSLDKDDFEAKIKDEKIRVVMMIHYFGFRQPDYGHIISTCIKHHKILIEDCSHTLFNNNYCGNFGEYSFYSLHKFLPMDEGAILQINDNLSYRDRIWDNISRENLLTFSKFDMEKIKDVRINNYSYLQTKLLDIKNVKPFYEFCLDIIPLNFPILVKDRDNVYKSLLEKGIETVSLYHTLIPQITKKEFPNSHWISKHILNLPIHEGITKKDIDVMVTTLKEIVDD
jgi:dTDP-4-amino-4,6-dideoxygalactose transaminase